MTDPTLTPRPATPVADVVSADRDDNKDAVAALAEIIEQQAGWTWYGQHGQHAESILGILKEQGWRLSRVDETPPDALREALEWVDHYAPAYHFALGPEAHPGAFELCPNITCKKARNLLNATPPASSLDEPK